MLQHEAESDSPSPLSLNADSILRHTDLCVLSSLTKERLGEVKQPVKRSQAISESTAVEGVQQLLYKG